MDTELIYLDHAAATPIDNRVMLVMKPYYSEKFFNPSSPYSVAVDVRRDYEKAKKDIASSIGAKSGDIVITAGATESINLAFSGISGHVITSNIEHQAVLSCAKEHANTIVLADEKGRVSCDKIQQLVRPDTELISIQLANNELGVIQPLHDIALIIKKERENRLTEGNKTPIYLHCDASQGAGLIDINVARLGVDMLTLNAGKIYGPKQVGLLWVSSHVKLYPQILGGGQERGLRSGTENVAGVVGFSKAIKLAQDHRRFEFERLEKLRDDLQKNLTNTFKQAIVSGSQKYRLPSYLHISFPGLDGERLIFLLEDKGVMVASGSACAANKGTRSHVLTAIGLTPDVADGSIRITLGHLSNDDNIKKATKILIDVISSEYKRVAK